MLFRRSERSRNVPQQIYSPSFGQERDEKPRLLVGSRFQVHRGMCYGALMDMRTVSESCSFLVSPAMFFHIKKVQLITPLLLLILSRFASHPSHPYAGRHP